MFYKEELIKTGWENEIASQRLYKWPKGTYKLITLGHS